MKFCIRGGLIVIFALSLGSPGAAATVYLNEANTSVVVGDRTSPGSFNNTFSNIPGDGSVGDAMPKVIDAPSANAEEFHNQLTHNWFTAAEVGGGLELEFTFDAEYDISVVHFWNYTGEDFDVDQVDFSFFNQALELVGELTIFPALGSVPGIEAEDIPLAAPLNVQYVEAFLTGTNRSVDFQNIGFSAELSEPGGPPPTDPPTNVIPVPAALPLILSSLALIGFASYRRTDRST